MTYKSSSEYYNDIQLFIDELEIGEKLKAAKRMKECFSLINDGNDDWKLFYRHLLLMKEEFGFRFNKDENNRMDDIIEAAKRVVNRL